MQISPVTQDLIQEVTEDTTGRPIEGAKHAVPQSGAHGLTQEVRRRIARGVGATALVPLVSAVIQFGSVPLLLHAWGAAKYGDWLLLSAIPSYLTLSDLGFGDASGSDMTQRVAAGDRAGALRTWQSSWVLLSLVSSVILLLACSLSWLIPFHSWLHLSSLSNPQAVLVILALAAYVVVGQQVGVLESGFRCEGNYAQGTVCLTVLRFSEAAIATAVGLLDGRLLAVALTYLFVRILGTLAYREVLRRNSPWLTLGFRHAEFKTVAAMAKPALGFIALPAGHAMSGQGLLVIVGWLLGPVAVTGFSTLRTLSRINFQVTNVLAVSLWPEFSAAFGRGDIVLSRKLHRRAYQIGLVLALVGGAVLWVTAPWVYDMWTRHAIPFNANCFHLLVLVTVLNSLWFISSVVPMATNAHVRIAFAFVLACVASLALSFFLVPRFGIAGAALALLAIDGSMTWLVLRTTLAQVHDTFRGLFTWKVNLHVSRREDSGHLQTSVTPSPAGVLEAEPE